MMDGLLSEGTLVNNRYRIIRLLGRGGMGAVYLCEDNELAGKVWALKEMSLRFAPGFLREQIIEQFKTEVKILATLNHPNLPHISHFFQENDKYFMVMEHVEGKNLAEKIEEAGTPLREAEVTSWAAQICDVLQYLHSQSPHPIIYRDLKPSNIMVRENGQIKLIDFGIARFFDPCKSTDTFKMGSVGFSPPEQYRGKGTTDARSDIYSLGATLHFLCTNRDPQEEAPFSFPAPRTLNSSLSPRIDRIIMRALEYKKERRFESAAEMKEALQQDEGILWNNALTRKFLTSPLTARFLENPAAQREKVAVLFILLFILGIALAVDSVKLYSHYRESQEHRRARGHYLRGQHFQEHSRYREALNEYELALQDYKDDIMAQYAVGLMHSKLSEPEKAEAAFHKTLKLDSKCAPALRELGYLSLKRNDPGKSREFLEKALSYEPTDGITYYYLALGYEKEKNLAEALRCYEEYLRCTPGAPDEKELREHMKSLR
ncbi:MAG: protein kinase [Candidatus Eremiobacteraeota bacterium]|nr:protein kinase [Candidatus Eremiobacteraeota bacterium]